MRIEVLSRVMILRQVVLTKSRSWTAPALHAVEVCTSHLEVNRPEPFHMMLRMH